MLFSRYCCLALQLVQRPGGVSSYLGLGEKSSCKALWDLTPTLSYMAEPPPGSCGKEHTKIPGFCV